MLATGGSSPAVAVAEWTIAASTPELSALPSDDRRWLAFLAGHSEATTFHHPAWSELMEESYRFQTFALVQRDDHGEILAGLPIALAPGGKRRRAIALPFTDYCPPLVSASIVPDDFAGALLRWQRQQQLDALTVNGALTSRPEIHQLQQGVRHVLPLPERSEQVMHSLRRTPLPRAIRKAERLGVSTSISQSRDSLEVFYRLHLDTRRRLGVPVQPRRFFESLWRHIIEAQLGFVVVAHVQGEPIAAAVFLAWNRNLIYKFGASDRRHWELRPNNLVMWTAIDWGCRNGYRQLDFGRSELDNEGLRAFKSRWGATEVPLVYSHLGAVSARSVPRAARRALAKLIQVSPPAVCRGLGELLYQRMAGAVL